MTAQERDSLMKLSLPDLRNRLALAEAVISDGIKEMAGATAIKEVLRQKDVIEGVIKDKLISKERAKKPEGVIIQMKPVSLKLRRL